MAKAKSETVQENSAEILQEEAAVTTAAEPTEEEKLRNEVAAMKAQMEAMQAKLAEAEEKAGTPETVKPAEGDDPWKRMVKVISPRLQGQDSHFVSVNDHRWQIPADGRTYEVPEPIAEALNNFTEAEIRAEEYMKAVERDSHDPVMKPKEF